MHQSRKKNVLLLERKDWKNNISEKVEAEVHMWENHVDEHTLMLRVIVDMP